MILPVQAFSGILPQDLLYATPAGMAHGRGSVHWSGSTAPDQ